MGRDQNTMRRLYNVGKGPIAQIRYVSESQECDLVEYLAYLDLPLKLKEDGTVLPSKTFTDRHILNKLFVNITEDGKVKDKSEDGVDLNLEIFLKNKYLYLYGEGASYYLQARESMSEAKKELDYLEMGVLRKVLNNNLEGVRLVSLGSANATKETEVLFNLVSPERPERFTLVPVDVSSSLIQLAVLNFYHIFEARLNRKSDTKIDIGYEKQLPQITPIIADIWDLPAHRDELFPIQEGKTIFTLLGSTLSNYKEHELLLRIIRTMNEGDLLVLGCDVYFEKGDNYEDELFQTYYTLGNVQFMLNPLNYIPKYKGYIERFDKYFKLEKKDSIVTPTKARYKKLSDAENAVCYAPLLELPIDIKNNSGDTKTIRVKMSVAQSTKYKYSSLMDLLISRFSWTDEFTKIEYKFDNVKAYSDIRPNSACFVLKKIITKDPVLDANLCQIILEHEGYEGKKPQKNLSFLDQLKGEKNLAYSLKKKIFDELEKQKPLIEYPEELLNILRRK